MPTLVAEYEAPWNNNTTPKTVSATAAANDVFVVVGGTENGNTTVQTPTGGTGITWTQLEAQGTGGTQSTCAIFSATPSAQSWTLSVARSATANWWGFNALRFSNSSGIGAAESTNNGTASGLPTINITTTAANSSLVAIVVNWNGGTAEPTWGAINGYQPTLANGGTVSFFGNTANYAISAAVWPDVGAAGLKTVSQSTPTGQRYVIAVVEVLHAAGGGTITGTLTASTPTVTVGPPTSSISGTVAAPVYSGDVAASTPALTVGPPTSAISGTVTAPTYSGTLDASTPAITVGPPTSSISGTVTGPGVVTGNLVASAPAITVGPPTMAASGTVTAPTYAGDLAAATAALTVGPPTMAWSGTATPPTFSGDIAASTPGVTVGPPTTAISGTVTAPGANVLIADTPTITVGPPTTSISGTVSAPVYAGAIAAAAPTVTVGPVELAMTGVVTAPTITGTLVASLPTITVGPLSTYISDTPIPAAIEHIGTHNERSHLGVYSETAHLGIHQESE